MRRSSGILRHGPADASDRQAVTTSGSSIMSEWIEAFDGKVKIAGADLGSHERKNRRDSKKAWLYGYRTLQRAWKRQYSSARITR